MPQSLSEYPTAASTKAGLLLMSPSKAGKSICAVLTSPPPVYVAVADPKGLSSVIRHATETKINLKNRVDFDQINSIADWEKSCAFLGSAAAKKYKTVVIDTVSILCTTLVTELERRHAGSNNQYAVWKDLEGLLAGKINRVMQGDYHVVMNCHAVLDPKGEGGDMGHVPAVKGQSKNLIMALAQDLLWLEVTPADPKQGIKETKREFLLGPQGLWKHGCRSLKSEGRMPADITAFLKRVGNL